MPPSFVPPNGAISVEMIPSLMPTMPYSSASAADNAAMETGGGPLPSLPRSRGRVRVGVLLAILMASASVVLHQDAVGADAGLAGIPIFQRALLSENATVDAPAPEHQWDIRAPRGPSRRSPLRLHRW